MLRIWRVLCIGSILLTFIGAGYGLLNKGTVGAGIAVIPMLFTLVFLALFLESYHKASKEKSNKKDELKRMDVQDLE